MEWVRLWALFEHVEATSLSGGIAWIYELAVVDRDSNGRTEVAGLANQVFTELKHDDKAREYLKNTLQDYKNSVSSFIDGVGVIYDSDVNIFPEFSDIPEDKNRSLL